MVIFGTSNSFKLSFYHNNIRNNKFFLKNTAQIIRDCDCEISNECSCIDNILYTGLSLDVTLLCGDGDEFNIIFRSRANSIFIIYIMEY